MSHAYKLYKSQHTNSARTNFFANRIVSVWNSSPATVDFNSLEPSRGLSNVQICMHSCCVIVLDVFFLLLYVLYCTFLSCYHSNVPYYCFYGHLSVQEFLPWCFSSMSEINRN